MTPGFALKRHSIGGQTFPAFGKLSGHSAGGVVVVVFSVVVVGASVVVVAEIELENLKAYF